MNVFYFSVAEELVTVLANPSIEDITCGGGTQYHEYESPSVHRKSGIEETEQEPEETHDATMDLNRAQLLFPSQETSLTFKGKKFNNI